jgi:hypothetical protein
MVKAGGGVASYYTFFLFSQTHSFQSISLFFNLSCSTRI